MELLVYFLTASIFWWQEYKLKSSLELLTYCLTGFINISRSPLWSSWSFPYWFQTLLTRNMNRNPCGAAVLFPYVHRGDTGLIPYSFHSPSMRNIKEVLCVGLGIFHYWFHVPAITIGAEAFCGAHGLLPNWFHTLCIRNVSCHPSFPHWFHALLMRKISRSPLWSSLSISLLISCTSNEECKQPPSVEFLVYFLTDFIHFEWGI